jgi:alpha-D-xyloside xylohydrolase
MAANGWLLKNAAGEAYRYQWDPAPFGATLTPLPTSGIVDFTHPQAYAYWRDRHDELFDSGIDVIKTDFGEQVPADAVAYNGDSGRRLLFSEATRSGLPPMRAMVLACPDDPAA